MWQTSNMPTAVRVARCSSRIPVGYETGIAPAAEVHHLGAEPDVGFVERGASHPADILKETPGEFKQPTGPK